MSTDTCWKEWIESVYPARQIVCLWHIMLDREEHLRSALSFYRPRNLLDTEPSETLSR